MGSRSRTGRRLVACVAVALGLSASVRGAGALTVVPSHPGNIFVLGETVEIPVQASGASVAWTATDYWGAVSAGSVKIERGAAVMKPALGRVGYFDLHLSARDAGGVEVSAAESAFAVLRPPAPAKDSPFGVMTHFAQGWNPDLMPLLAKAGLTQFRDEQYWDQVETRRGAYEFPAMFRNYMKAAAENGLHPLLEMTFANGLYDQALTPYTDEGREGFADYGKAVLDRYRAQVSALEIWNEYNGTWCTGPATADRPRFYTAMLKAAYARIKAARPDVTVLGGAAVLAPLPWFEDLFADGALDALDAVAIHPYRGVPEGVENDLAGINEAMRRVNHGVAKPIWATECSDPGDPTPGRRSSARYLVRLMTLMRSCNVQRIYWYLGRDYNEFVTGLLHGEASGLGQYAPTATYVAYSNLIAQLSGVEPVRREEGLDPRTRVYLFKRGAEEVRVAWTVGPGSRLMFRAAGPLRMTNIMGETSEIAPVAGVVSLPIDESPIYVVGKVGDVQEAPRADRLLADTAADFNGTQGKGGWSYGYVDSAPYDPAAFQPMSWTRSEYAYQWQGPFAAMFIGADTTHPGASSKGPVWAVRRWQSDVAGEARIVGTAALVGKGGDGVGVLIYCSGREVYSGQLGGAAVAFGIPLRIGKGDLIDFVLTPGPGTNINFDATSFRAQIVLPLAPQ